MTISRQNLPDGTIKLILTIPQKRVDEVREKEIQKVLAQIEVKGFRKGKAPKKLAQEKIDKQKLLEQVVNQLIPQVYQEAIQKESIKPIIAPKIKLLATDTDKDWQIEVQTCQAPEVNLGNYKKEISQVNPAGKIWTPGSAKAQKPGRAADGQNAKDKDERLQKILNKLMEVIKLDIPGILVEQELNRRLSALIDKTEKLGMSLEQYLQSTSQTVESLRQAYGRASQEYWQLEFILNKIADEEKLSVSENEITLFIDKIKEKKEREAWQNQQYLVANLLRRQKTLDFLLKL